MTGNSGGGISATTPQEMRKVGAQLAAELRAGDLVLLHGPLGAGKTTLAQGIGAGLRVRGPVTSPTFVIARVHPSLHGGPPLVHVDAYRLQHLSEIDDLDLDGSTDESVTVVEWGEGKAEQLSRDRLDIAIDVSAEGDGETRHLSLHGVGSRWDAVVLPSDGRSAT